MNTQNKDELREKADCSTNEEKPSVDPSIEQSVDMALILLRIILERARYERKTGRPFPRRGVHHG